MAELVEAVEAVEAVAPQIFTLLPNFSYLLSVSSVASPWWLSFGGFAWVAEVVEGVEGVGV